MLHLTGLFRADAAIQSIGAYGRAFETWWIEGFTDLILRAVRGENMFVLPRSPETVPPPVAPVLEKALANEAEFEAKLAAWLAQRKKPPPPR
jgi:hypothetical protein